MTKSITDYPQRQLIYLESAKIVGIDFLISYLKTPNISNKKHGIIQCLIVHHTACDFETTIEILLTPGKVSANYVIDKDGTIVNFGSDNKKLWHAGISKFSNFTNLNDYGPGIEMVNNGVDEKYTNQQMAAFIVLSHFLIKAYNISPFNILGHGEIAPDRKVDPSVHFDYKLAAKYGIGFFPNQKRYNNTIISQLNSKGQGAQDMKCKLYEWGYRSFEVDDCFDRNILNVVCAFKRRYFPEEYKQDFIESWTQGNQDLLNLLISKKNEYERNKNSFQIDFSSLKSDNPLRKELLSYKPQLLALGLENFMLEQICA